MASFVEFPGPPGDPPMHTPGPSNAEPFKDPPKQPILKARNQSRMEGGEDQISINSIDLGPGLTGTRF